MRGTIARWRHIAERSVCISGVVTTRCLDSATLDTLCTMTGVSLTTRRCLHVTRAVYVG